MKSHNFSNEHLATGGKKSDRTKAKRGEREREREGIRGMDQSQQIINGQTSVTVCKDCDTAEVGRSRKRSMGCFLVSVISNYLQVINLQRRTQGRNKGRNK